MLARGERESAAVRILRLLLLVGVLLPATGGFSHAAAQGARAVPTASRAAAERAAVDLRHGMTLGEVQRLLGKPWRTALTSSAGSRASSQGTLRWTYIWIASPSMERSLNIDFDATAPEGWTVSGWSWSSY
jgi:hypothetical protein